MKNLISLTLVTLALALTLAGCGGSGGGLDTGGTGGGGGGETVPFSGRWTGPFTGDLSGSLNALIGPTGSLSINGTVSGAPGFSGSGRVTAAGSVFGSLDDGKGDFSGNIGLDGSEIKGTVTFPGPKTVTVVLRKL